MAIEQPTPPDPVQSGPARPGVRWLAPLVGLVIVVAIGLLLLARLRQEVWAYFTDDDGLRVEAADGKARPVLWEDPRQNLFAEADVAGDAAAGNAGGGPVQTAVNDPGAPLEPAFAPNETMMVLVRKGGADGQADLFLSTWNGRIWSPPAAITAVNTGANELGPAISRDGRYLYFSSDRPGGLGGEDLYVARWNGTEWTGVAPLGASVNTPANESGPAPGTDDSHLFFSSNRGGEGSDDIFSAQRLAEAVQPAPEEAGDRRPKPAADLPPVPKFGRAEVVSPLNSDANEVQAALTGRGEHLFLSSDRSRPAGSGFGLYHSRVVDGRPVPPERVDLALEAGEVTDPAVRMDGFDLLVSAGTGGEGESYRLFRTTTREVIPYTDLTRWEQFKELMESIGWWIVLALLALAALLYLLERWQDITSLFHKCLAGSAVVHLLILLLTSLWLIAKKLESGGQPQSEVAISIDALAEEELALESEPEKAEIAETDAVVVTEKFNSDFMIPIFEPVRVQSEVIPIVTQTSRTSLVPDVRPSKLNEAQSDRPVELASKELAVLTAMEVSTLPEPEETELQEEVANLQERPEPADPTADLFRPTDTVDVVKSIQAPQIKIAEAAMQDPSEAKDVEQSSTKGATADTGGETVVAHRGLEAQGALPELVGKDTLVTMLADLPGSDPENDPLLPGNLETPVNELDTKAITKLIQKARGKPSLETIVQLGGSDATEKAIREALEWLVRNQEADGRWDARRHGANGAYDTAGTGLALLCFYGWGVRHDQAGPYQDNVRRALDWLVAQQAENGDLRGGAQMYSHGIASIALCEAYGVTNDPRLKGPAEKAIALILASQSPTKGGWRYDPAGPNGPSHDADLSVTGWQYMALHSARLAGLEVPEAPFEAARRYLQEVSSGTHGGLYGYTAGAVNAAMVATGMFCRQLDLVPPTDPRMPESAQYLKMQPIPVQNPDFYYLYYGTLALYQHQGPVWLEWNERLKETLPLIQRTDGNERGSWDVGAGHGAAGGRVVSTTLAVLSLEVYYRLLPMYGFRGNPALPGAKQKQE